MSNEEKSKPKAISTEENIQAIKERIINTNKLLKIFDVKEEENKKAKETIKKLQEELQEAKNSSLRSVHQDVVYKDEIARLNDTLKKYENSFSEKDEATTSLRQELEKLKSKFASLEVSYKHIFTIKKGISLTNKPFRLNSIVTSFPLSSLLSIIAFEKPTSIPTRGIGAFSKLSRRPKKANPEVEQGPGFKRNASKK
ncbi:hypothetical protein K7432_011476 [Basidiobolus ranarum]|uniref:Uncharacterized protein n=1 Tax=Basidiobolus ranarum TaxID=34480 RepID=A0ABR2VTU6_9FUNG